MATITVGILGLGRIGASIGLALKRYNSSKGAQNEFRTVGYDPRTDVQAQAEKMGVADSIVRAYFEAVSNRDIVVLALPYADVQATYRAIAPDLRDGAVILDTSPLKLPSIQWSEKHLSPQTYMVGVTPIVNPDTLFDGLDDTAHARADLFDKGSMLLMPSPRCAKDAVELSADFATILGATPHFLDPAEHDGLVAATEGLPALLGIAAFYTLYQRKSWDDAQRVTNPNFGRLTHHLVDSHPDDLRDLLLNNRQNTLNQLDQLIGTLQSLRTVLEKNDRDALEAAIIDSASDYQSWLTRRVNARWDDSADKTQASNSVLSGLMGGFLADKLRRDKNKKN